MRGKNAIILIALLVVLAPRAGLCKDSTGEEKVFAIQERIFQRDHELTLSLGYIPDEDFYNVFPVGIGYTYHFNDFIAWEVARGMYLYNREKDLKKDLENDFGVTPSEFLEPKYMVHSNLVIKPFYGKESIWNRSVLNHESYFLMGGGIVNYEKKFSYGDTETETAPSICLGYGIKYFLSKSICMNLEIRDLVNLRDDGTENNIYLGVGITYRYNLSARKTDQDETVDKLKGYLDEVEGHGQ
ncbi:outer membrane beta-barrel domain-containing protein [bacterium]|nr:outer membrane beta-barrel domain-containing protein [bacterium]